MTNDEAMYYLGIIYERSKNGKRPYHTIYQDAFDMAIEALRTQDMPSAQPEKRTEERTETHACDLISRQEAIDAVADLYWMDERLSNFKKEIDATFDKIKTLPSAQPEVLACGEGELIAQPEIVRCKDCKYWNDEFAKDKSTCWLPCMSMTTHRKWYCGSAERRTDDSD